MDNDPVSKAVISVASKVAEKSLGAATQNLVGGLSRLVGSYFLPGVMTREARAKAESMAIATEAEIEKANALSAAKAEREFFEARVKQRIAHLNKNGPAPLYDDAFSLASAKFERDLLAYARKEDNFRKAVVEAIEVIENSSERDQTSPLDPDFLLSWIEAVEKVTDEQLRRIWARLLACHATGQDFTLTPHSIDIVRRLRPRLVGIFERVGPLAWLMGGVEQDALGSGWLSMPELEELIEIGLLKESEAAKIRFGYFTISFQQRDEAKRATHFYELTQAGKQIFRLLSPNAVKIFGKARSDRDVATGRRRLDLSKSFEVTMSFFDDREQAVKFIADSSFNLVTNRRMNLDLTFRPTVKEISTLLSINYDVGTKRHEVVARDFPIVGDVKAVDFGEAVCAAIRSRIKGRTRSTKE
ncbi:MAG: DUF2806 domain-containing protein [Pseudomonadota bacterium]